MNDYLLPRYSKNDVREYWSILLDHKRKLQEEIDSAESEHIKIAYSKALDSISLCMNELEKKFDLF